MSVALGRLRRYPDLMELELTPTVVKCPTHGIDLTERVRKRLSANPIPVASFGVSSADSTYRNRAASAGKSTEYLVMVFCPGDTEGKEHRVPARGEYRWKK